MANFYAETIKREPNRRGKPRLVSALAELPDALHHGFDGDGTAPKRGKEAGRYRLWAFEKALPTPLPDGVVELTTIAFDTRIADREAAKPALTPEGLTFEERQALFKAANNTEKILIFGRRAGFALAKLVGLS